MTEFHISEMTPSNDAWVSYQQRCILSRCRTANDPLGCVERGLSDARRISGLAKSEQKRLERESYVVAYERALEVMLAEAEG